MTTRQKRALGYVLVSPLALVVLAFYVTVWVNDWKSMAIGHVSVLMAASVVTGFVLIDEAKHEERLK